MFDALRMDFECIPNVRVLTLEGTITTGEETDFRELASQSDGVVVVAPELEGLLEQRTQWAEESGRPLLCSSRTAVASAADKWLFHCRLSAAGIPSPQTTPAGQPHLYRDWSLPWILKPRRGAGSQHVRLVSDGNVFETANDFIVQKFVSGIAASVSFLVSDGTVLSLLSGFQNLSENGRFQYRGGRMPLPPEFAKRAEMLGRRTLQTIADLRGFVGIDLVLGHAEDGSGDAVIEINPRVTSSYLGLRRLTKENLAKRWLDLLRMNYATPITWQPNTVTFSCDGRYNLGTA